VCRLVLVDADVRFSFSFPALGQGKLPIFIFSLLILLSHAGIICLWRNLRSALCGCKSRSSSVRVVRFCAPDLDFSLRVASSRDYQSTGRWPHSIGSFTQYSHSDPVSGLYLACARNLLLLLLVSSLAASIKFSSQQLVVRPLHGFLVSLAFSFSRGFRFAQPVFTPCEVSQKFLLVLSFHGIASVCFTRSVFLASNSKAAACSACVSLALPSWSELLPWLSGNQANRCY
jgi:hypothetical protein